MSVSGRVEVVRLLNISKYGIYRRTAVPPPLGTVGVLGIKEVLIEGN